MRRFGKLLLFIFAVLFLQVSVVSAASKCDYSEQVELNNAVANIKVSYEEAEALIDPSLKLESGAGDKDTYYNYFKVQIYNVPENIYLKVTNDINNEIKYLQYKDSESGVITFNWEDLDKVVTFTFTAYSNNKTNCPNEVYRIITLTLPRYNSYSEMARCSGNESYYLCQKYITDIEDVDFETFMQKVEEFENSEDENDYDNNKVENDRNLSDFIKNNIIIIGIISTIVVISGVVAVVIVIKRRRSR